jgi:hypothetical protein
MKRVRLSNGAQLIFEDDADDEYMEALIAQQEEEIIELTAIREGKANVRNERPEPRPSANAARPRGRR